MWNLHAPVALSLLHYDNHIQLPVILQSMCIQNIQIERASWYSVSNTPETSFLLVAHHMYALAQECFLKQWRCCLRWWLQCCSSQTSTLHAQQESILCPQEVSHQLLPTHKPHHCCKVHFGWAVHAGQCQCQVCIGDRPCLSSPPTALS